MATKATQQVRVNTTRYLDEDGLEVLWEKIKAYVEEHSVTVDGADINLSGYVTVEQLEEALENIDTEDIDLTAYQTKEELAVILRSYSKVGHVHNQYLTEHQSLDGYATEQFVEDKLSEINVGDIDLEGYAKVEDLEGLATETFVTNAINNAQLSGGDGTSVDLSIYATKDELTGLATETYVENAIKNAEIDVDLTDYALKSELPDLTSYATQNYVDTAIENASLSGGNVDLSNYPTEEEMYEAIYNEVEYLDKQIESDIKAVENEIQTVNERINNLPDYATTDYVDQKVGNAKYPIDGYVRKQVHFDGTEVDSVTDMPAIRTYAGGTRIIFDKETTMRIYKGETQDGYFDQSKYVEYTGTVIDLPDTEDGYLTDYIIYNPIVTDLEAEDPNIFVLRDYDENRDGMEEIIAMAPPKGWAFPSWFGVSNLDADTLHQHLRYSEESHYEVHNMVDKGYIIHWASYADYSRPAYRPYMTLDDEATASPNTVQGAINAYRVDIGTPYEQLTKVNTMGLGVNIDDFSKFTNTTKNPEFPECYYDGQSNAVDLGSDGLYHPENGCFQYKGSDTNRMLYVMLPPGKTYTIECTTSKIGWRNVNTRSAKTWGVSQCRVDGYVTKNYKTVDGSYYLVHNSYDSEKDDIDLFNKLHEYSYVPFYTTDDETGDEGGYLTINNEYDGNYKCNLIALGVADYSCAKDIKIVEGTVPYSQLTGNAARTFVNIQSTSATNNLLGETYTIVFSTDDDAENDYARYSDNAILKYINVDNENAYADVEHTHTMEDITDYVAPDLSEFVTKAEIPDTSNLATKDEIPNLTGYLKYEVVSVAPSTQLEGVLYIVTN